MSYQIILNTYHNAVDRTRFSIPVSPGVCWDPDIILSNVGSYYTLPAGVANVTINYPIRSGVGCSIKRMTLYINDKIAEVVEDVPEILAFNALMKNNGNELNISSQLSKVRNSFKIQNTIIDFKDNTVATTNITGAEATTTTGTLSLVSIFGSLRAMAYQDATTSKKLINAKYQSLYIDIEWNTNPFTFTIGGTDVSYAKKALLSGIVMNGCTPVLICKKYTDPKTIAMYDEMYLKGFEVPFYTYGKDEYIVPTAVTSTAPVIYRLKGPLGKTLNKCVVQNKYIYDDYTSNYNDGTNDHIGVERWNTYCGGISGNQYSTPNDAEVMQLIINSKQFFPGNGIDSPAKKALYRDYALQTTLPLLLPHCDENKSADAVERAYMSTDVLYAHKLMSYYVINMQGLNPNEIIVSYGRNDSAYDFLLEQNANGGVDQKQIWRYEYSRILALKANAVMVSDV